ncbi:MAG: fructosamine kinase family protein [Cyanobacteria bacterium M_surface_10_m2_179]|nr:fructosamine kinase family protein [Cyanobacteria bacterium M_surface_10_m2_179]
MQQQALGPWLQQRLGLTLLRLTPVGGGCIHNAWQLELADGSRLFAKTNRAELLPVLEAEADGLTALRTVASRAANSGAVPQIPEPLACEPVGAQAVLVLGWLDLRPTAPANSQAAWTELGRGLARLHRASSSPTEQRYGWSRDNFIGSGPQANGWRSEWATFFIEQRLQPQLQIAAAQGKPVPGAIRLLEALPAWLGRHQPEPCLVHGDLWGGNAGLLAAGGAALFDPAVYRGDREVDLAMAHLFGGFPAAFFAGYEQEWPLPAGHPRRVELYNLYHLLNHANLFGGGYWQQSAASVEALSRGIPCAGSEPW